MPTTFPIDFSSGAIAMGYLVAGVFFLSFWRRTRDSLFMIFAIAFWLLAINQLALTLSSSSNREQAWIYLIRLAAFSLLIIAVVVKNMQGSRKR